MNPTTNAHGVYGPQGPQDMQDAHGAQDVHDARDAQDAYVRDRPPPKAGFEGLLDATVPAGELAERAAAQLLACAEPRQRGALGERFAAAYLARLGWLIVARNYRTRWGELDLICMDPSGRLVFVEVKTRSGMGYGGPREAVTRNKQRHLKQAAALWMQQEPRPAGCRGVRFDVLGVLVGRDAVSVDYIEGAFV